MNSRRRYMAALVFLLSSAPAAAKPADVASAGPSPTPMQDALTALQRRIEAEQQRLARIPTPVAVRWKGKKLVTVDVSPDIAAVAVADLNHNGRAEIFVAGNNAVAVIELQRVPKVVASVRFTDPLLRRSRQNVGSALLQDASIVVQVTSHALPLTITWDGQNYAGAAGSPALFQFCSDRALPLVAGRNWFDTGAIGQGVYTELCRNDLADAQGHLPSLVVSVSERDQLRVETRPHCDEACGDAQVYTVPSVGYAVAIDDVDQNGIAEVYSTAAMANADVVNVTELGPAPRALWKRKFTSGVVALATGDFDGDGRRDVWALVRAGRRVEVWSLQ